MPSKQVLVLFEPGRAGRAAMDAGGRMVREERAELTVVAIAPQASSGARCGSTALDYNGAVRDQVREELEQACLRLVEPAQFRVLTEATDPSLAEFAASGGFDSIVLPARRRPGRSVKHPAAGELARLTDAEIRIVGRHHVAVARS